MDLHRSSQGSKGERTGGRPMPDRSLAACPASDLTWFRMARSPLSVSSRAMRDGG